MRIIAGTGHRPKNLGPFYYDETHKDCIKYNTAAARGWKVFRFPGEMVEDGSALQFLMDEVWK